MLITDAASSGLSSISHGSVALLKQPYCFHIKVQSPAQNRNFFNQQKYILKNGQDSMERSNPSTMILWVITTIFSLKITTSVSGVINQWLSPRFLIISIFRRESGFCSIGWRMGSDTDSFKLGRGSTAYNSWSGVSNNPQTDAVIILGEELPAKLFLFSLLL